MNGAQSRPFAGPLPGRRKILEVSSANLVRTGPMEGRTFPLVVEPEVEGVSLETWARGKRDWIESALTEHGALLFRGFDVPDVATFDGFVSATSDGPLEYQERSSPRSQVQGNIYTSTDHPASEEIFLHTEQSYNLTFPRKIYFYCVTPAAAGGATPIADCRKVLRRIDPRLQERLAAGGYLYVRNFGRGFGLPWQAAFQTEDPAEVEAYCRRNRIAAEWRGDGRLRTRQVRPVIARHPRSGEPTWFNHATFFHVSTLDTGLRRKLLESFGEEDLPNNTYYADGSPIAETAMDELREAYRRETVSFPWRKGDILMLDNMLVAHGREPFAGERKVAVAMADPVSWDDVQGGPLP